MIYSECEKPPEQQFPRGLAKGAHEVEIHATLPNTPIQLATPPRTYTTTCDALGDGGGCSTGRPASLAFVLLAFAALVRRQSGKR